MPGGTVVPLTAAAQSEVARLSPHLSIDRLNRIASEYRVYRDHKRDAPTPATVRREFEGIVKHAQELRLALSQLSEEAGDLLWFSAYRARRPQIHQEIRAEMTLLINVSKGAHNDAPTPAAGRTASLEGGLVRNLGDVVQNAGLTADAKPNGWLCRLTAIVLKDMGKEVADIPDLVARSLGRKAVGKNT